MELCHKHKVSHRKVSVSTMQDGAGSGKEERILQETQKEIDLSLVSHVLQSKCLALKKPWAPLSGWIIPLESTQSIGWRGGILQNAKCMCWNHSLLLPAQPHKLSLTHSRSHFWFVSCHLKHKQSWGARREKWGGGGMGWSKDEARFPARPSSSFHCPQEWEHSSRTAWCVDPIHIPP